MTRVLVVIQLSTLMLGINAFPSPASAQRPVVTLGIGAANWIASDRWAATSNPGLVVNVQLGLGFQGFIADLAVTRWQHNWGGGDWFMYAASVGVLTRGSDHVKRAKPVFGARVGGFLYSEKPDLEEPWGGILVTAQAGIDYRFGRRVTGQLLLAPGLGGFLGGTPDSFLVAVHANVRFGSR